MSTAAAEGLGVPAEKKKGLSKYISRMKTVLKRSASSKRLSQIGRNPDVASSSTPAEPLPVSEAIPVEEAKAPEETQPRKLMRSQIAAERARKLGERFSLTIEPLIVGPDTEAIRIEKPIRVRIHRICHICNTTFGVNRVCAHCHHSRCAHCPRYPTKKVESKGKDLEGGNEARGGIREFIEPDTHYSALREEFLLTKPSPRPGAQPLVRKKPKQRVRRTCHECSTLFGPGIKICPGCGHVRCADCPRDPAKKHKYPNGYPGDMPSSNITLPVRYSCHRCRQVFPSVPHPSSPEGIELKESGAEPMKCIRCQHPMCPDCPRAPPTRVEPAPDPDVLKSVQARLEALNVANIVEAT